MNITRKDLMWRYDGNKNTASGEEAIKHAEDCLISYVNSHLSELRLMVDKRNKELNEGVVRKKHEPFFKQRKPNTYSNFRNFVNNNTLTF